MYMCTLKVLCIPYLEVYISNYHKTCVKTSKNVYEES